MLGFGISKTLRRLDEMLTDAINGEFSESNYSEAELSRLESKWKQYLTTSRMSMDQTKRERQNIKALISDISHQTKTPLSNIMLYSELLREQPLDQDGVRMAECLFDQAEKLEFLIQSLVKMSRLESDILEVKPKRQKIEPLLTQALDESEEKANQKGIRISLRGAEDAFAVYDLKWTAEALYNIVDNAIKYSGENDIVSVTVKEYEIYLSIIVKDNGIGIRESERAQIFKRFYRSGDVQQADGVGIGLYFAREIVHREGGYIKVQSVYGQGSSFGIYLPKENRTFQKC